MNFSILIGVSYFLIIIAMIFIAYSIANIRFSLKKMISDAEEYDKQTKDADVVDKMKKYGKTKSIFLICIIVLSILSLSIPITAVVKNNNEIKAQKEASRTRYCVFRSIEKREILVDAIGEYESHNDSTAKNKNSSASGHLQILKVMIDEANNISGYKKYEYQDRYNKQTAIEIFNLIQNKYNPKGDIEKAIRLWNGGPHYNVKSTQTYYENVRSIYNKKIDEQLDTIIKEYKSLNL